MCHQPWVNLATIPILRSTGDVHGMMFVNGWGERNLALHTRFDAKDPVCAVLLAHVKHDKIGKKCSEFSRKEEKSVLCECMCE